MRLKDRLKRILRPAPPGTPTLAQVLADCPAEDGKGRDRVHDFASILCTVLDVARERGMARPGSEYAFACYQIIETAISEAEVWDVALAEIGLEGFDTNRLLQPTADPAGRPESRA